AAPLFAGPAAADTNADEAQFVAFINAVRVQKGLRAVAPEGQLISVARAWSAQMAGGQGLSHNPSLGTQVTDWRTLGENVGTGASAASIEAAFEASPHHYENMVDPNFQYVGVGVVQVGATLWVIEDYKQSKSGLPTATVPQSAPAPSSPTPRKPGTPASAPAARAPAPAAKARAAAPPAGASQAAAASQGATPSPSEAQSAPQSAANPAPSVLAKRANGPLPIQVTSARRLLSPSHLLAL